MGNDEASKLSGKDILQFIRTTIPSVWTLEVLLLLKRTAPRAWRIEPLIAELRSSANAIAPALIALRATGLVIEDNGAYEYRPASPALDSFVAAIADLYAVKPTAVLQAIASGPTEKLIMFANAFKIKD